MKVYCDQCQALAINGVPCHETGCPNSDKRWESNQDTGRCEPGEIYERYCPWCGCAFETTDKNKYSCCSIDD